MRNAIVIGLALIAILAGGVWALGQFGGGLTGGVGEPQAPLIREPEIVAANTPAAQPVANPEPSLRSAPAAPAEAPLPTPRSVNPEQAQPVTPATPDAGAQPTPPVSRTLDGTGGLKIPAIPKPEAVPQSQAMTVPAPETPAAPPQTQAQTVEPRVTPQQAPSQVTAVTATGLEAQFKSRQVVYNRPPKKLALDKAIDVSLVVNATGDDSKGTEALEGFQGTVVERDVELSDTVSAQLTGIGFDITSQTVERQRLSGKTVNRWQWRVTPTETGTRTLILEIFGYATGSLDAEPLDAYRDDITVEVQQFDQVVGWARSVQPLFAVLAGLAAVGSAAFAFLRFREEKKQTKAMSSKSE